MIIFLSVFPPFRGGIARFSDYLYRNLQTAATVETVNFKKLYPPLLFPGTTQYDNKPDHAAYASALLHAYNPFNWRQTAREIAARKPDVLLLSYWHPFFIPAFSKVIRHVKKQRPHLKTVTIAHNVVPHERFPFSAALMKSFFGKNDTVITLSSQTEQEFEALGVKTKSVKLFHPVYESEYPIEDRTALRKKYGFKEDDRIILFFGLVREYKGLDVLIEALNGINLKQENIKVWIAGEFYDDKNKYISLIRPELLDSYTITDRFVTNRESAEIMSVADLLALPYKTASQSGVLADALNFTLPAVVSDHPGITEYLTDGVSGLIFENKNTSMLKDKINIFINNNNLQENIKLNLTVLKAQLSWKAFTEELNKYL